MISKRLAHAVARAICALLFLPATTIAGLSRASSATTSGREAASLDYLHWRNIGPFRGGRATAVAGTSAEPFTFYMGTAGGGIFKTTDAGTRWANVSDGFLETASVGALAVAPSNPEIVYSGMGEDTARANTLHSGDGLYKSEDAGKTWKHLGLADTQVISRIIVDPKNPDIAYVAAQGALYAPSPERGVYRTEDGGATWKKVLFVGDTAGISDLSIDPKNAQTLYAAVWDYQRHPWALREAGPLSGIYKTTDGGDTWQKIDDGLPATMGRIGVAVSSDPERIYAIVQASPNTQSGLYRSNDGGAHWALINAATDLTRRAFYYMKIFTDPKNADVVWLPNLKLFRSEDGGKTFSTVSTHHGDHHEMWISPADPKILAEADDGGGTISLDDGKTWSQEDNQPTGQFYRLSVDDAFPYRIYSAQQDSTTVSILSRSVEARIGVQDWYPVGGSESSFVDVDPKHPERVFASDYLGIFGAFSVATRVELRRPIHGTFAWANMLDELTKYRFSLNAPLFVSRHDPRKIYFGGQKLLVTEDEGRNWREASPDLTRVGVDRTWDEHLGTGLVGDANYDVLTSAAESPISKTVLWTGSGDGIIGVSRDSGKTWTTSTLPAPANVARINVVEPSHFRAAAAYVAATGFQLDDKTPYLFKTNDFGKTWLRIGAELPANSYARVIREAPERVGLLYAGTETGVWVSFDDGKSWRGLGSKLPVTPITDLVVHGTDLVVSTSGRGIWILDDLASVRETDSVSLADEAFLFNPAAAIRTDDPAAVREDSEDGGENPPSGAILDLYLKHDAPISIEVRERSGKAVRHLTTAVAGAKPGPDTIKTDVGMNRILWDLRAEPPPPLPDAVRDAAGIATIIPRPKARLADPGIYTVTLTLGGRSWSAPLRVEADPRWKETSASYIVQDRLLDAVGHDIAELRTTMVRAYSARTAIEARLRTLDDPVATDSGKALIEALSLLKAGKLYIHYAYLDDWVNTAKPDVIASEKAMYPLLHAKWISLRAEYDKALGADLASFNAHLAAHKLPLVRPTTELPSASGSSGESSQEESELD